MGTDQPELSKVLRGRMTGASVGRLTTWLTRLGYDVTISVKPKPGISDRGHLSVVLDAE